MTEVLSIRNYDYSCAHDASIVESLTNCYAKVFADPPWNESWSRDATLEVLGKLDGHMNYIACDGKDVVGFAFARFERTTELEDKLGIGFASEVDLRAGNTLDSEYVVYQSDLGVLAPYRRQGLGKRLFRARIGRGFRNQIVRARQYPLPSVTYTWYTEKLGYEVIARYPEEDGRVILFQRGDVLVRRTRLWDS